MTAARDFLRRTAIPPRGRGRLTSLAAGATAALLVAGCGSTVALTSQQAQLGNGGVAGMGPAAGMGPEATSPSGTDALRPAEGSPARTADVGGLPSSQALPTEGNNGTVGHGSRSPANRRPLSLGVVLTEVSNAAAFGVKLGNTYDERQVDQALIDALNAQGGLGGRRIVPTYAVTDTGSSNWNVDFAAACATFTQDHHVEAVLGYVFEFAPALENCLARRGIPHLSTGFDIKGAPELAGYPLHLALDTPTIDRRALAKIDGAAADGYLRSSSRLGVLMDSCPGTQRSYEDTVVPELQRLKVAAVKPVTINCSQGSSDVSATAAALQNAELQFATSGVDTILFHSVSEGPALLLFAANAESQNYHPKYLVSSLANLESLRSNLPETQLRNVHAYGWNPTQDIPPAAYPRFNARQQRCLGLLHSRDVKPTAGLDYYLAFNFCDAVFSYEQALARTHGDSQGKTVFGAVARLGEQPSATVDGPTGYHPAHEDVVLTARQLRYTEVCSCFRYLGPARPIRQT